MSDQHFHERAVDYRIREQVDIEAACPHDITFVMGNGAEITMTLDEVGYRKIAFPLQNFGELCAENIRLREQVTGLEVELAELRRNLGEIVPSMRELYGKTGHKEWVSGDPQAGAEAGYSVEVTETRVVLTNTEVGNAVSEQ